MPDDLEPCDCCCSDTAADCYLGCDRPAVIVAEVSPADAPIEHLCLIREIIERLTGCPALVRPEGVTVPPLPEIRP